MRVRRLVAHRHAPGTNATCRERHAVQAARFVAGRVEVGLCRRVGYAAAGHRPVEVAPEGIFAGIVYQLRAPLDENLAIRQRLFVDRQRAARIAPQMSEPFTACSRREVNGIVTMQKPDRSDAWRALVVQRGDARQHTAPREEYGAFRYRQRRHQYL